MLKQRVSTLSGIILFCLMLGSCAATGGSGTVSENSGTSDDNRQPSAEQRAKAEEAMRRATRFMVEEVSTNGGYVRTYLADLSRRWAEIEAYETQIWVETGWGGGRTRGVRLPDEVIREEGRTHPFFIEPETGKALYYHRRGTSVLDESYWINYDSEGAYSYGMNLRLDLERLKSEYRLVSSLSPDEVSADSPLTIGKGDESPEPFSLADRLEHDRTSEAEVREILNALDEQGQWLVTGEWVSDPYRVDKQGNPSNTALRADPETARGLPDLPIRNTFLCRSTSTI